VTKVLLEYDLVRPLADEDAKGIADIHSYYGIIRVKPAASLDKISVEFDASRLGEKEVEATLHHFGIPIRRKWAMV
jgi:hypothetical protein